VLCEQHLNPEENKNEKKRNKERLQEDFETSNGLERRESSQKHFFPSPDCRE